MSVRQRVRRLVAMFLCSVMLACVPGIVVRVFADEDCHPIACHGWGYGDWQYWWFGCERPHCSDESIT